MIDDKYKCIPFHIEINRVIELLAKQIYQTPMALLRENCQNAFDAILIRKHSGQTFSPRIDITIASDEIIVKDNGIGMTTQDLENHFWRAGSSGKNTPEAKAAGVVGTFGIGAMANFGVASELCVITESAVTMERTKCIARRDTLSATEKCIEIISETPIGEPGTSVIAKIQPGTNVNISEATTYLTEIVKHLDIPVFINENMVSKRDIYSSVPRPPTAWEYSEKNAIIGPSLSCDIQIVSSANGELWVSLTNMKYLSMDLSGIIILRQSMHQIRTFRSKFALAAASVSSHYGFGGCADLMELEPTAGREALTTHSLQIMQSIVTEVEHFVSGKFSQAEYCDQNTSFMQWVLAHNRVELCGKLKVRIEPGNQTLTLEAIKLRSKDFPMNYYDGSDQTRILHFATEDRPLVILSTRPPRRNCEMSFFQLFCNMNQISNKPSVLKLSELSEWTMDESSFAFRLVAILSSDYFVQANVNYGKISDGLPILVDISKSPVEIVLDSSTSTLAAMLQLYKTDFEALSSLAKDFVRNVIFPKISNLVPSSTRQGAEAFLKAVRRPKDIFEYEFSDLGTFSSIWQDYLDGKINLTVAAEKSVALTQNNFQVLDRNATQDAAQVIPDVLQNEQMIQAGRSEIEEQIIPLPAITRMNIESNAKLLLIDENNSPLKGYRCFIAITERVREERADFFLQPHGTEIVWGGQKAIYIFQHHSREFALYYEFQAQELLSFEPGGQIFPTCTIVIKNQIYIPVPEDLRRKFIPDEKAKKRFEIRCELLYPDISE